MIKINSVDDILVQEIFAKLNELGVDDDAGVVVRVNGNGTAAVVTLNDGEEVFAIALGRGLVSPPRPPNPPRGPLWPSQSQETNPG